MAAGTIDGRELAAIFVGGFVGAIARAELLELMPYGRSAWPWPTFIANVAGALLLGYFITRLHERLPLSSYRRPLLGTGFCGAVTTFSTMQIELVHMIDDRAWTLAAGYAGASIAAGFVAIALATNVVRRTSLRP